MSVRATFQVTSSVTTQCRPGYAHVNVILEPRDDQSITDKFESLSGPEDVRFLIATPSGRIERAIDNPLAIAQLTIGATCYVDCTPVVP